MKITKIITGAYEQPLDFDQATEKFYEIRRPEDNVFVSGEVTTQALQALIGTLEPHIIYPDGITQEAPTGQRYEKITVISDSVGKTTGLLIWLVKEYVRRNRKLGRKYIYFRIRPCLRPCCEMDGEQQWQGYCRLVMSKTNQSIKTASV
jgi:hypothetical protein